MPYRMEDGFFLHTCKENPFEGVMFHPSKGRLAMKFWITYCITCSTVDDSLQWEERDKCPYCKEVLMKPATSYNLVSAE